MSVICFGADELANVLVFVLSRHHSDLGSAFGHEMARDLATYAGANHRAYVASYGHRDGASASKAVTAREIAIAAKHRAPNAERAIGTLQLMQYNLYAQSGRNYATARTRDIIACLALEAVRWYSDREEMQARQAQPRRVGT